MSATIHQHTLPYLIKLSCEVCMGSSQFRIVMLHTDITAACSQLKRTTTIGQAEAMQQAET